MSKKCCYIDGTYRLQCSGLKCPKNRKAKSTTVRKHKHEQNNREKLQATKTRSRASDAGEDGRGHTWINSISDLKPKSQNGKGQERQDAHSEVRHQAIEVFEMAILLHFDLTFLNLIPFHQTTNIRGMEFHELAEIVREFMWLWKLEIR